MKKVLLGFCVLLPILYLGFCWHLSSLVVHGPPRRDIPTAFEKMQREWKINRDSMLQLLPQAEEVSFDATPLPASPFFGQKTPQLHAWLFPSGKDTSDCAVVMAHGITDNRSGMLKYTAPYADCGCELLLYDHRAHHMSGHDDLVTGGIYEAKDVVAAHSFLKKHYQLQDQQIGWIGESWGAAAVLIAGGNAQEKPAFIVADSPFSSWKQAISERAVKMFGNWISYFFPTTFKIVDWRLGIDHKQAAPKLAAPSITAPTLIVHSAADVETSPKQSQEIYDAFSNKHSVQLELLDWGSWHAQAAARRPHEYSLMVSNFLDNHAPGFCQKDSLLLR